MSKVKDAILFEKNIAVYLWNVVLLYYKLKSIFA